MRQTSGGQNAQEDRFRAPGGPLTAPQVNRTGAGLGAADVGLLREKVAEITVNFDIGRTRENLLRRKHWSYRSREMGAARLHAHCAWVLAGCPTSAGPVRVSLVIRRARAMDNANCWTAAKALLDGIFVKALTPDDSPKWVSLGELRQEISREHKGRESVVVIVEAAAASERSDDVR